MIRSKQLLPFYKGARTWLVAGTTCGSRPNSKDGSPANYQHEEQKSDYIRDGNASKILTSLLKADESSPTSESFVQVKSTDAYALHTSVEPFLHRPLPLRGSYGSPPGDGDHVYEKRDNQPALELIRTGLVAPQPRATNVEMDGLSQNARSTKLRASQDATQYGGGVRDRHRGTPPAEGKWRKNGSTSSDGACSKDARPASAINFGGGIGNEVAPGVQNGGPSIPSSPPSIMPKPFFCHSTAYVVSVHQEQDNFERSSGLETLKPLPSPACGPGQTQCSDSNMLGNLSGGGLGQTSAKTSVNLDPGKEFNETLPLDFFLQPSVFEEDKPSADNQEGTGRRQNSSPGFTSGTIVDSTKIQRPVKYRGKVSQSRSTNKSRVDGSDDVQPGSGLKLTHRFSTNVLVDQVCGILNNTHSASYTRTVLNQLDARLNSYQVNEVLKHQSEAAVALQFFQWAKQDMGFRHDVHTYTTMIGLLGRARSFYAMELLLEEMHRDGIKPSVVTFNRLIYSYGKAGLLVKALDVFHHMQKVACEPDRVTYCTLIDVHAKEGLHDTAMQLCRQMQQAGLHPDTFTYGVIIHSLGKAGKANAAHKLFREMLERGCNPSIVTHNIILDLHAKAGNWILAIRHYNDMQDAGFQPNKVTYSIMMEVLGNSGHIEDAEHVIFEMEQGGWDLDAPIYGLIIDMWGKAGYPRKAWEWYQRMLDHQLAPNVQICNSLCSMSLRLDDYQAAKDLLGGMTKLGLVPNLQTYTVLLSCCTTCKEQKHLDTVLDLLAGTGQAAHSFLCTLLEAELQPDELQTCVEDFFSSLKGENPDCRRRFADALMDFLHKLGSRAEAGCVWEVARASHIYPLAVKERDRNYWCINLHVMSMGTALTALSKTLISFKETMLKTGRIPERVEIITGWGKRSKVTGSSLVKQAVEDTLTRLGSPFQFANVGCFVSEGRPMYDWLHRPGVAENLAF